MVTPASYALRIEATGFDPREIIETLGAGENKVINTITLGAADGGFRGTVLGPNGTGLGNVEVAVRSGDIVKTTKTPTSGNVGSFIVDSLETPRTYTLTFSLAGYADQTIAVDLQSGETRSLTVTLTGGQATVSGQVTDEGGVPIGGAIVNVGCGTFTANTATLTTSGAADQAGTYSVVGVPAPATCTIVVASDGYLSQTIRIDVATAGFLGGNDVILPRATGSVSGTAWLGVGTAAAGATDVIVELSNGTTNAVRSTVTTSSPAGLYRFADIVPGDYTLTFRKAGLVTRIVIVTVTAGQTVQRDVNLSAS
ncbi:MAG TPA: carboxypeptidase-like regulatory domain-containing protein [Ilumatobacteraceae bacterium]|nr:carboxypeptidase-like regulatory domain-containing protein [Ilumatobacteraceae bacterium]